MSSLPLPRRALLGRAGLIAGLATSVAGPSFAQGNANRLWFDPTQLPSFSGVVDRYLLTPDGKTDRLLFREGPQIIFPEHVGDEVMAAVPPGQPIVVYGIRARRAPAITMLAWAKDGGSTPRFVDRPSWTFPEYRALDEQLQVSGTIRMPLLTPQGEPTGAVLEDGSVIRLPASVAAAMTDRLVAGRAIAAIGRGASAPDRGRSVDAERIGDAPDKLGPLPQPAERPQ